jgi:hypothetical protein
MEENVNRLETLLEKAAELGKSSLDLYRLRTVEKTADVVSTIVPYGIVFILFSSFLVFLNVGLALWFGKIIGNTFYGFFIVAAFYATIAAVVHFFMHEWLKRLVNEFLIKLFFKKDSDE